MKKIFLPFILVLMIACSNDSQSVVNDTSTSQMSKHFLNNITIQNHPTSYDFLEFENNVLYKLSYIDSDNLHYYYEYSYNEDGQLYYMQGKDSQDQLIFERTIDYDTNGKIIGKNDIYYNLLSNTTSVENVIYIYNDQNNTVTADFTSFDELVNDRVYYFGENGLLLKITEAGNTVQEFNYDGNNIITNNYASYIYDNETEVKGEYLNIYKNQFNSYANFVLYNGYMVPTAVNDKYMLEIDGEPGLLNDVTFSYEFDEQGYPIEENRSSVSGNSTHIVITYKETNI